MTYPMALAKQAKFKNPIQYFPVLGVINSAIMAFSTVGSDCDFNIVFNRDKDWYFGNGSITHTQYDLRFTAAREITKGLGFSSNMALEFNDGLELTKFSPVKYNILDNQEAHTSYMSPLDSLIYGEYRPNVTQRNMAFKLQNTSIGNDQLPLSTFFRTRESNIKARREFLKVDNWRVKLKEGRFLNLSYIPFDSMVLSASYGRTREFLMNPLLYRGCSIDTLMRVYNNGSLYGPLTLEALQLIGHATPQNPHLIQLYNPENVERLKEYLDIEDVKKDKNWLPFGLGRTKV